MAGEFVFTKPGAHNDQALFQVMGSDATSAFQQDDDIKKKETEFRILELAVDLDSEGGQVGFAVRFKQIHARKIFSTEELIQIGDTHLNSVTLSTLKNLLCTPKLGLPGYNTILTFRKTDGEIYRFPAETMRVRLANVKGMPDQIYQAAPPPKNDANIPYGSQPRPDLVGQA